MFALANIFYIQNDLKASEYLLLKLVDEKDLNRNLFLEASYLLADVNVKQSKIDDAVLYWQKIISITPDFKDVSAKLSKYSSISTDNLIKEFSLSDKQKFIDISKKLLLNFLVKLKLVI